MTLTQSPITSPSYRPASPTHPSGALNPLNPLLALYTPTSTGAVNHRTTYASLDQQVFRRSALNKPSLYFEQLPGIIQTLLRQGRGAPGEQGGPKCRLRSKDGILRSNVQYPNILSDIPLNDHAKFGQKLSHSETPVPTLISRGCHYRRHNSCRGFRIASYPVFESPSRPRPISQLVLSFQTPHTCDSCQELTSAASSVDTTLQTPDEGLELPPDASTSERLLQASKILNAQSTEGTDIPDMDSDYPEIDRNAAIRTGALRTSTHANSTLLAPLEIRGAVTAGANPPRYDFEPLPSNHAVPFPNQMNTGNQPDMDSQQPEIDLSSFVAQGVHARSPNISDYAHLSNQQILDIISAAESQDHPAGPDGDAKGSTGTLVPDQRLEQYTPEQTHLGHLNGHYDSHDTAVDMDVDLEDQGTEEAGQPTGSAVDWNSYPYGMYGSEPSNLASIPEMEGHAAPDEAVPGLETTPVCNKRKTAPDPDNFGHYTRTGKWSAQELFVLFEESDKYNEENIANWKPGKQIETALEWDTIKWKTIAPIIEKRLGGRKSIHQVKIEAVNQKIKRSSSPPNRPETDQRRKQKRLAAKVAEAGPSNTGKDK